MKPDKLMIGDWVSVGNGEYYRLEKFGFIEILRGLHDGDFEPIPLTAELLEKNGFRQAGEFRKGYGYDFPSQYYDNMIYLRTTTGIWNIQCAELIDIKYVHELQHTLRLCGLDELANNFKI